jgi:hypothetical protein
MPTIAHRFSISSPQHCAIVDLTGISIVSFSSLFVHDDRLTHCFPATCRDQAPRHSDGGKRGTRDAHSQATHQPSRQEIALLGTSVQKNHIVAALAMVLVLRKESVFAENRMQLKKGSDNTRLWHVLRPITGRWPGCDQKNDPYEMNREGYPVC